MLMHVVSLKKELDLQGKLLDTKLIKKPLRKRECEEFNSTADNIVCADT